MSTITTYPIPAGAGTVRVRPPFVVAAIVFAITAVFDLAARPPLGNHHYHQASMYIFTALLIPFALAMVSVLAEFRSPQAGRLGATGFRIAVAGLLLFIPCAIASLATGNPHTLGPAYMLAMLLSLAGTATFCAASTRAGVLARSAALALPIAWFVGGPIGEGGDPIGFRGAALLLAAVVLAIAARGRTSTTAPATQTGSRVTVDDQDVK